MQRRSIGVMTSHIAVVILVIRAITIAVITRPHITVHIIRHPITAVIIHHHIMGHITLLRTTDPITRHLM
jgi:hypothetical protein